MKGGSKVNDGLWIFKGVMAHRYCLALEVSHSQEYKEVKKKVRTLIAETKGRPALGIIVNINYDSKNDIIAASDPSTALDRTSFITVFHQIEVTKNGSRRREVQEMASRQVFIEADGSIIDGQIELSISDIIGSVHLESYKKDPKFNTADELVLGDKVIIPHRALAAEIQDAEASILADWKSRASGEDMGPDGPTYINTDNDTASSSDDSFPSTSSLEKDDKRKDPSYSGKASASSNPSSRGPSSRNAKKT
ncbi:hypothetical protein NpNSSI1_00012324 [Neofusicoccum parvum]|nr:hypothetical protein NpNSSI1_00012324 [Neofusicoccum parvum]